MLMGSSVSLMDRIEAACVMAVLLSSPLLSSTALAGTETGEFCPTCPDWTNLEGWLAQREAYERAQQSSALRAEGLNSSPSVEESYPVPELIAYAGPELMGEEVVLDVRSRKEFLAGHIPGARSLYWREMQRDGRLDPDLAVSALRRSGVNSSDRIVVCGGSDEGAAFVFWALSYLGHRNISLLDGGVDAAWSSGIAPESGEPPALQSNYTAHTVPWLCVTEENLEGFLNLSDVRVLDARDFSEYGRNMLGNSSIPLTAEKLFDGSRIKDASTLRDLLDRRALDDEGVVLVYGTPQAYWLFYCLSLMGYNATLLEGDWWMETPWAVSKVH